ncbi:uncharacterized protein L3040_008364 [Drepanopeziza brunnea f. sp. 'multigermtubi']|uniref:uncharacterized protein n=1 Tax=Drepanopeziza brunnea f. sp. 'multigermtubi' TaxID=698441 RepID=UPI002397DC81|nr:hypothetical protein L3040_008364 [Drepanopeziza brunnea f. sp. 'multigermtubi']
MVCNSTNCAVQGSRSDDWSSMRNLCWQRSRILGHPWQGLPNLRITLLSSYWSAGRYKLEVRRFSGIFSMAYGEASTSPARDRGDCDR